MIELRKGIPGDGPLIAAVRQKAWSSTYRGIFPDDKIDQFDYAGHIARDELRLKQRNFFYDLAMDEASCVGYVSYGEIPPGTYKDFRFRLQSIYLLPAYQGRGLGRKMMEQAFRACRTAGFDKLFWECSLHNQPALGFYANLGAIVTQIDGGHENRQDDICCLEYFLT